MDALDLELLGLMLAEPRAGVREYARRLHIARGTAQARIDKMVARGVITSWAPTIDPSALGYAMVALVHVHIAQARLDETSRELARFPEVLEVDSVAGEGDLLCRVVARDHAHYETLLSQIIATPGVLRTRTEVVLNRRTPARIAPLITKLRSELGRNGGGAGNAVPPR